MGRSAALLLVALALAGCSLGSGSEPAAEPRGDIGWSRGLRIAERASFPVRVPAERYRLVTASWTGNSVTFDLLTPRGRLVSLEQASDRSAISFSARTLRSGLERSLTQGAIPLGVERIAGKEWRVFWAPALGGLLVVRSDSRGLVVALHGDTTRTEFRDLAASLRQPA
jgi:Protein of unknown function (DUF4245)